MTTVTATHPLGLAATTAHPWDDAVRESEAEGLALDARVVALTQVVVPAPAVEAELRALAREISAAATREGSGGQHAGALLRWRNTQIGALQTHARRLGYDGRALELR